MNKLIAYLNAEPALVTAFLQAAAALAAGFWVGVTQSQEAAIVVIGGILVTLLTAAFTRPVHVAVFSGAITAGLTAAAAFGLKLQPQELAFIATGLTLLSSALVRLAPDVFALAHLSRPAPTPVPPA
jgi:hypothetical protein